MTFQFLLTLICLSSAPVAKYLPSGLKLTERMYKSPSRTRSSSKVLYLSLVDYNLLMLIHLHNTLGCGGIVNVGGLITASSEIAAICTEFDAANYAAVLKGMNKITLE
jgi:hypothetical protein